MTTDEALRIAISVMEPYEGTSIREAAAVLARLRPFVEAVTHAYRALVVEPVETEEGET
jgi:hypothetical protein